MIEPLYDSEGKLKPEADLPIIPEVKKEESVWCSCSNPVPSGTIFVPGVDVNTKETIHKDFKRCASCGKPISEAEVKRPFTFDANAVMFVLYLFYKDNVISNHNLKHMLKIIKDPMPEDVIKFIAEEAGKAV